MYTIIILVAVITSLLASPILRFEQTGEEEARRLAQSLPAAPQST